MCVGVTCNSLYVRISSIKGKYIGSLSNKKKKTTPNLKENCSTSYSSAVCTKICLDYTEQSLVLLTDSTNSWATAAWSEGYTQQNHKKALSWDLTQKNIVNKSTHVHKGHCWSSSAKLTASLDAWFNEPDTSATSPRTSDFWHAPRYLFFVLWCKCSQPGHKPNSGFIKPQNYKPPPLLPWPTEKHTQGRECVLTPWSRHR